MTDKVGLDRYEKGGYYRVDDRSGARVRAYNTREEWNGALVDAADFEPRNQQEFLRSVRDDQSVPKPRPVPPLAFVGPLETTIAAAAPAGTKTISVVASAGYKIGDRVGVATDDNNIFFTTIQTIPDGFSLALTAPLPFSVSVGALVISQQPVPVPTFTQRMQG